MQKHQSLFSGCLVWPNTLNGLQQAETRDRKEKSVDTGVKAHGRIIKGLNQESEIRMEKQRVVMCGCGRSMGGSTGTAVCRGCKGLHDCKGGSAPTPGAGRKWRRRNGREGAIAGGGEGRAESLKTRPSETPEAPGGRPLRGVLEETGTCA